MAEGQLPLRLRIRWTLFGRSRRTLAAWGIICLAALCFAGTSMTIIDLLGWRDAGKTAREVSADPRQLTQQRVHAIIVMQREARATIAILRQLEQEGGELAAHARNALLSIEQAEAGR